MQRSGSKDDRSKQSNGLPRKRLRHELSESPADEERKTTRGEGQKVRVSEGGGGALNVVITKEMLAGHSERSERSSRRVAANCERE